MKTMRLLVYGDIGGSGGYVQYCKGVFGNGCSPNDLEIYFVCSEEFYKQLKPLDRNIKIITHSWLSSRSWLKRYIWHIWIYPRIVKKICPDIEFYPSGHLRVYLRSAITVSTSHNLALFDSEQLAVYKNTSAYNFLLNYRRQQAGSFLHSTGVIFLSDYSRRLVMGQLPSIGLNTVIPHGIGADLKEMRPRYYKLNKTINILYVSSILFYKNHIQVVRAIKRVREVTGLNIILRFIGDSEHLALKQLKDVIYLEKAQDYIEMAGQIAHDSVLYEYAKADIFVFASSCESCPVILLEAMAAGLPIACSDSCGLPDLLKDAGVYFNPKEPPSIAEALMELLTSEEKRRGYGQKAYKYSRAHTWESSAKKTFDFIRRVYKSKNS